MSLIAHLIVDMPTIDEIYFDKISVGYYRDNIFHLMYNHLGDTFKWNMVDMRLEFISYANRQPHLMKIDFEDLYEKSFRRVADEYWNYANLHNDTEMILLYFIYQMDVKRKDLEHKLFQQVKTYVIDKILKRLMPMP